VTQPLPVPTAPAPGSVQDSPSPPPPKGTWARVQAFRERHQYAEIGLFFAGGFLFDVLTLDRIDNWGNLAQQGAYLVLLGLLLLLDQRYDLQVAQPGRWFAKAWRFSEDALHFLFGSLLSMYALFFFKSASGLTALAFLAAMFGLMVANELPVFRSLGPLVRLALYSLCLCCYFAYLLPVAAGFLSPWLFVLAVSLAVLPFALLYRWVRRWTGDVLVALRRSLLPGVGVPLALLGLYFAGAIPPVPLSIERIGVYHSVKRVAGGYELAHERPDWKIWQRGDQSFKARDGDVVYVFARIFAPGGFKGEVYFHWVFDDPKKGWQEKWKWRYGQLTGGRSDGYAVFASGKNYVPGDWRVELRTGDGRELGRIHFSVEPDASTEPRQFKLDQS
jgi:hypothetical protein